MGVLPCRLETFGEVVSYSDSLESGRAFRREQCEHVHLNDVENYIA